MILVNYQYIVYWSELQQLTTVQTSQKFNTKLMAVIRRSAAEEWITGDDEVAER